MAERFAASIEKSNVCVLMSAVFLLPSSGVKEKKKKKAVNTYLTKPFED